MKASLRGLIAEGDWQHGFALLGALLFFVCAKKSKQKKAPPASGSRCARLPSLRCRSGGRLTRAIPGPLSLSPHPCGSLPYATTPTLGLLTGSLRACRSRVSGRSVLSVCLAVGWASAHQPDYAGFTRPTHSMDLRCRHGGQEKRCPPYKSQTPSQQGRTCTTGRAGIRSRQEAEWDRCVSGPAGQA
jgi:hypothetical protein